MRLRLHLLSAAEKVEGGGEAIVYRDGTALSSAMLAGVRDIMGRDLRNGHLDLAMRIDAEDESGAIVETLHFEDAVTISRRSYRV